MQSSSKIKISNAGILVLVLIVIRLAIGWHFCYEGLVKLYTPGWTSASFLDSAEGVFSGIFKYLASSPELLKVTDFLNVWGLFLGGAALILGVFDRWAAFGGAFLLLLYYTANPPFGGMSFSHNEGSYYIVSKNLIELLMLVMLGLYPTGRIFGIGKIYSVLRPVKVIEKAAPILEEIPEQGVNKRRELLKAFGTVPIFGAFAFTSLRNIKDLSIDSFSGATIKTNEVDLKDLKGELPKGKLKNLELSRLIIGCNLIGGWSHSRDLLYVSPLFKAYNTNQKVFETLHLAEKAGINATFMTHHFYPLLNRYKKEYDSKMFSICQAYPEEKDLYSNIDLAIKNGADAIYIQGGVGDTMVKEGRIDQVGKVIEYIKKQGFPAGVGSHSLQVTMMCEKEGFNPDFYVKTFHHDKYWSAQPLATRKEFSVDSGNSDDHQLFHDNIFDLFPDQTAAFMKTVNKPWFAFKVLAAGAIKPEEGFKFAFENGADFICVGMFDFQVVNNVNIANSILNGKLVRQRNWYS
ncbi:MAG: DoxX family protein [Bacteroidales bacterium]